MSYISMKIRKCCNTKNNSRNATINDNLRNRKIDEMLDLTTLPSPRRIQDDEGGRYGKGGKVGTVEQ